MPYFYKNITGKTKVHPHVGDKLLIVLLKQDLFHFVDLLTFKLSKSHE
jgi:hypothetical protein